RPEAHDAALEDAAIWHRASVVLIATNCQPLTSVPPAPGESVLPLRGQVSEAIACPSVGLAHSRDVPPRDQPDHVDARAERLRSFELLTHCGHHGEEDSADRLDLFRIGERVREELEDTFVANLHADAGIAEDGTIPASRRRKLAAQILAARRRREII